MDKKHEAIDLYKTVLQQEGGNCDRQGIFQLITTFLISINPSEKFHFHIFGNIISESAINNVFWMEKMGRAFENIEAYIILLYNNPWKAEFHKIKKYCGFYQTKIQSHLKDVESIFNLVGYAEDNADVLMLRRHVGKDVILHVAFDCLVASVECKTISTIYKSLMLDGISVQQVLDYRKRHSGSVEQIQDVYRKEILSKNGSTGSRLRGPPENSIAVTAYSELPGPARQSKQQQPSTRNIGANSSHVNIDMIPFIDDDSAQSPRSASNFTEGTFDDHMMASLQMVKQDRKPSEAKTNIGSSEDWSFVRQGLEQKYGKKYYDGQRGDILHRGTSEDFSNSKFAETDEGIADLSGAIRHMPVSRNISAPPKVSTAERIRGSVNEKTFSGDSDYRTQSSARQQIFYPPLSNDPIFSRATAPATKDIVYPGSVSERSRNEKELDKEDIRRKSSTFPPSLGDGNRNLRADDVSKAFATRISTDTNRPKPLTSPIVTTDGQVLDNIDSYRRRGGATNIILKEKIHSAPVISKRPKDSLLISESSMSAVVTSRSTVVQESTSGVQPHKYKVASWKCLTCTYENPETLNVCHMCSKSRVLSDGSETIPKPNTCYNCTLVNPPDETVCQVCERHLTGTSTII